MAHKKGVGSTDNGRDSKSKRLGVKIFGGQHAKAGNIIIRQRGTKYHAGENTYLGKDFTLHAAIDGVVAFRKRRQNRVFVSIIPEGQDVMTKPAMPKVAATASSVVEVEDKSKTEIDAFSAAAPISDVNDIVAEATAVVEAPADEPLAANPAVEEAEEMVTLTAETAVTQEDLKAAEAYVEEAKEEAAPPVTSLPSEEEVAAAKPDKLTKIEGIGPKIESLLHEAGITTFALLSETKPERIKEILLAAGNRYKMHDPTTWPKQAAMAAAGQWDELNEYQDRLDGGKEVD